MKTNDKNNGFEGKLLDLQNNMLNFALTLTTNKDEAKDLLQETTLRALDNKEKYLLDDVAKSLMYGSIQNRKINEYK